MHRASLSAASVATARLQRIARRARLRPDEPLRRLLGRPLPPRVAIVQAALDRSANRRYLEIGVHTVSPCTCAP